MWKTAFKRFEAIWFILEYFVSFVSRSKMKFLNPFTLSKIRLSRSTKIVYVDKTIVWVKQYNMDSST